ncbi:MAG: PIN domain-containing protein [Treponema sp.]
MKAVIDTNIIIDAFANREPFYIEAQKVLLKAALGDFEACITSNTVTDIFYILHKSFHNATKVKSILENLFSSVSIISIDETDCKNALSSKVTDYEDAILCESSVRNKVDYIITRNISDFKNSQTRSILPSNFLKLIK